MRRHLVVIVCLLILGVPLVPRTVGAQEWPTATPAAVGLNAQVLDSIDREIREKRYGYVTRFLVIRKGKIAYDKRYPYDFAAINGDSARARGGLRFHHPTSPYNYFAAWWHPTYRGGELHTLQSVTKTVTSVVIGTAVTRGEFPSIDTPVLSFFDTTQVRNIDDRKRRLTIRHLLTMTGGFDWNENLPYIDPRNSAVGMEASYDWVDFTINLPMAREPGERFNYSSGESALLAHIFYQATGTDIEAYAARHLFTPLGIREWFWKRSPAGLVDTEGGLYLEAKDLARIWELFVRGGVWHGTRIVSADWVRQSVAPAVAVGAAPNAPRYGLKWWLWPNPADPSRFIWAGSGFGGQLPMAFPERELVVVFNGWNIIPGQARFPQRLMHERLARAVR
jgi:CubicO group peptidase (beta-lactamase class C family)